jgi:hypothetical protein
MRTLVHQDRGDPESGLVKKLARVKHDRVSAGPVIGRLERAVEEEAALVRAEASEAPRGRLQEELHGSRERGKRRLSVLDLAVYEHREPAERRDRAPESTPALE